MAGSSSVLANSEVCFPIEFGTNPGENLPSESSAKFNKFEYENLNGDIECGCSVSSVGDGEDVGLSVSKSEAGECSRFVPNSCGLDAECKSGTRCDLLDK